MGKTSAGSRRRWLVFFSVLGSATILAIWLSVSVTYEFQNALPPGCEACGLAAAGLVPYYALSAVLVLTLFFGLLIWLYRRTESRMTKAMMVVLALIPLAALVYLIAFQL
ncbi:hypothetical protein [Agromyces binzhouensis]|uniref:hypothetical protein n=1 Tax=Agromyces binzhouensis TaxID=1817495 RepID=UPI003624F69B